MSAAEENVTEPGEAAVLQSLRRLWKTYLESYERFAKVPAGEAEGKLLLRDLEEAVAAYQRAFAGTQNHAYIRMAEDARDRAQAIQGHRH